MFHLLVTLIILAVGLLYSFPIRPNLACKCGHEVLTKFAGTPQSATEKTGLPWKDTFWRQNIGTWWWQWHWWWWISLTVFVVLFLQWCWIVRMTSPVTLVCLSWSIDSHLSLTHRSSTPTCVLRVGKLSVHPTGYRDDILSCVSIALQHVSSDVVNFIIFSPLAQSCGQEN